MKTLIITLLTVVFIGKLYAFPFDNQPESTGMVWKETDFAYATVIGDERKFFFSCGHWPPQIGDVVTFKNGSTGVVKKILVEQFSEDFDFSLGEFVCPVDAPAAEVWWHKPKVITPGQEIHFENYFATSETITTSSHSFSTTGWYENKRQYKYKMDEGFEFSFQSGASGSPVFFEGKLIGIHFGSSGPWANPQYGFATPISSVFEEFWQLFPDFAQPPNKGIMEIQPIPCNRMLLTFKRKPSMSGQIEFSNDLTTWFPIESPNTQLESIEYEGTTPWTTKAVVSTIGSSKAFFRGK